MAISGHCTACPVGQIHSNRHQKATDIDTEDTDNTQEAGTMLAFNNATSVYIASIEVLLVADRTWRSKLSKSTSHMRNEMNYMLLTNIQLAYRSRWLRCIMLVICGFCCMYRWVSAIQHNTMIITAIQYKSAWTAWIPPYDRSAEKCCYIYTHAFIVRTYSYTHAYVRTEPRAARSRLARLLAAAAR